MENKVALVTGATGALGRVVAKTLLQDGASVMASYRTEGSLNELLEYLGPFKDRLFGVKADVTNEKSVRELVRQAIENKGKIDILVNIVGAYAGGTDVATTEEATWDTMMNVNLKSVFLCSKTVLPYMMKQNYGKIVNVSSITAVEKARRAKSAAYAVSKAGVIVLTEAIATEVRNFDINVNCIVPSTIDTPSNRRNLTKADFSKWVDPADIAKVILFLVSDTSKVTSGASVPVYGKA